MLQMAPGLYKVEREMGMAVEVVFSLGIATENQTSDVTETQNKKRRMEKGTCTEEANAN